MIVILVPMFAVRLLTSAMSPSFVIVKKQKVELILQSLFLMSSVVSFLVSKIYLLDIYGCLKIISLLFTASYIIYLIMIFIYSRIKLTNNNMARIAILSAVNIKHMSLISLYTEILKKME